jgi:hypothetical protein
MIIPPVKTSFYLFLQLVLSFTHKYRSLIVVCVEIQTCHLYIIPAPCPSRPLLIQIRKIEPNFHRLDLVKWLPSNNLPHMD